MDDDLHISLDTASDASSSAASDSDIAVPASQPVKRSKVRAAPVSTATAHTSAQSTGRQPQSTVQQYDAQIEVCVATNVDKLCDAAAAVLRTRLTEQLRSAVQSNAFSDLKVDDDKYGVGNAVKKYIKQYLRTDTHFKADMNQVKKLKQRRDKVQRQQQLNLHVEPVHTFADVHLIPVCQCLELNDILALRQVNRRWRTVCQQRDAWKYIVLSTDTLMHGRTPALHQSSVYMDPSIVHDAAQARKVANKQLAALVLAMPPLSLEQLQRITIGNILESQQVARTVLQHLITVAPSISDIHVAHEPAGEASVVQYVRWPAVTRLRCCTDRAAAHVLERWVQQRLNTDTLTHVLIDEPTPGELTATFDWHHAQPVNMQVVEQFSGLRTFTYAVPTPDSLNKLQDLERLTALQLNVVCRGYNRQSTTATDWALPPVLGSSLLDLTVQFASRCSYLSHCTAQGLLAHCTQLRKLSLEQAKSDRALEAAVGGCIFAGMKCCTALVLVYVDNIELRTTELMHLAQCINVRHLHLCETGVSSNQVNQLCAAMRQLKDLTVRRDRRPVQSAEAFTAHQVADILLPNLPSVRRVGLCVAAADQHQLADALKQYSQLYDFIAYVHDSTEPGMQTNVWNKIADGTFVQNTQVQLQSAMWLVPHTGV